MTIRDKIDGYKFVYSLSYNGIVFYIGCTKDVLKRYKQHIRHTWLPMNNSKYIADLISKGIYPDLIIIAYLPEDQAQVREMMLIKAFNSAGHKLTNFQWVNQYSGDFDGLTATNERKALEIVKYKQDRYLGKYPQKPVL